MTLQADEDNIEGPPTIQKRVQIINNCTCLSCDRRNSNTDCELSPERTAELPTDLLSTKEPQQPRTDPSDPSAAADEIPELLKFLPNKTRTDIHNLDFDITNITTKQQKYELNARLIALLRSIQEQDDDSPNFNYDRAQLRELLEIIEGSEHQLSDKNLMEFVNFVNVHNSEDLELDLSRLKEVLTNFQKSQELAERHRSFGLGGQSDVTMTDAGLVEGSHHGLGQRKGAHIAMGLHEISNKNSIEGKNEAKHFDKKHYAGEEQKLVSHIGLGHLVKGPHGSLVLEEDHPKGVEEKLNVDPDMLKPNHAGTVLSYENHPNHPSNKKSNNN